MSDEALFCPFSAFILVKQNSDFLKSDWTVFFKPGKLMNMSNACPDSRRSRSVENCYAASKSAGFAFKGRLMLIYVAGYLVSADVIITL